ncbi:LLM class flavin-dependent oxidoreductase [Sediminivirga luteola]|uniref:Monooxygenase n=1 Tax=Sediminivirga luteola TaxID=1774748 RepID=A0A8J2U0F7_9MICO|nr:LLM class flavin-dependent oxidoreductase [Sediminivirga luteola]GGA25229.1 monooxygenase [Sediminivirga luteola]
MTFTLAAGLGVADDHPGAAAHDPGRLLDPGYWLGAVQLAERAGFDLVTLHDRFGPGRLPRLDTSLLASWLAARTAVIGLLPTMTTTHTEPFHVGKNLATLDHISGGRAGWLVAVSRTEEESRLVGRGHPALAVPGASTERPGAGAERSGAGDRETSGDLDGELQAEAADAIEVARRLWDSWEDDAEIRDTATGRFIDRDKVHYIDFTGRYFSVKGPSITPRPPQGQPVVVIPADSPAALRTAVDGADAVLIPAPVVSDDPAAALGEVREAQRRHHRRGAALKVFADVPVRLAGQAGQPGTPEALAEQVTDLASLGYDGVRFLLSDQDADLPLLAESIPGLLRARGLRPDAALHPGGTLRTRLGLRPAVNRYGPEADGDELTGEDSRLHRSSPGTGEQS